MNKTIFTPLIIASGVKSSKNNEVHSRARYVLVDNMVGGGGGGSIARVAGGGRGWARGGAPLHYVNVQKLSDCSIQHGSRATDRPPRR